MNADRAQVERLAEYGGAQPKTVITALFDRMGPVAQQELIDHLQHRRNTQHQAAIVNAAREAMGAGE